MKNSDGYFKRRPFDREDYENDPQYLRKSMRILLDRVIKAEQIASDHKRSMEPLPESVERTIDSELDLLDWKKRSACLQEIPFSDLLKFLNRSPLDFLNTWD